MLLRYWLLFFVFLTLLASSNHLAAQSMDSLRQRANQVSDGFDQRVDSVRQSVASTSRRATSLTDSAQHRIDSLTVVRALDTLSQRYQSVQQQISSASSLASTKALPNLPALPPQPSLPALPTTLPSRFPASQALDRVDALAQQYTQQLTGQVQPGTQALQNAPAALEQRALQLPDMDLLQQSPAAPENSLNSALGQTTAPLPTTSDAERIREQMKQQARQEVQRHFAQHTEELQAGQQRLTDLKKKYKTVQSEQDKYERATSLRGEPWTARLLLGSYFQFYGAPFPAGTFRRKPSFQVDVSPFVGYRFNTRWSVGVGGSCRVLGSAPVYQGRVFVESVVYRGFALHAAYERSWQLAAQGERSTAVGQHVLAGIGKSYRITRRVQGTTLLLYRPGDLDQSLQLSRWNLRTGFYLN